MSIFTTQEYYNVAPTSMKDSINIKSGIFNNLVGKLNSFVLGLNPLKLKYSVGTVAAAGNSQATATLLQYETNLVTASDDTKGVILPIAYEGACIKIVSTVVTKALKIYPASGEIINALEANAVATITPAATYPASAIAIYQASGKWYVYPTYGILS